MPEMKPMIRCDFCGFESLKLATIPTKNGNLCTVCVISLPMGAFDSNNPHQQIYRVMSKQTNLIIQRIQFLIQ